MARIIVAMLAASLWISGCGPEKLTPAEQAREKMAVEAVVAGFWKAHETKDARSMNRFLTASPDFLFFGSDSAEVIRTRAQWEAQKRDDVQLFESLRCGALKNFSVLIDERGEFATALGEIPLDVQTGGEGSHSLDRFALVMTKEQGEWRIRQGLITFATVGQSSAELVARYRIDGR